MRKPYQTPALINHGSIAENTFCTPACQRGNPGGTKSGITTYELDSFGEYSHPASSGS